MTRPARLPHLLALLQPLNNRAAGGVALALLPTRQARVEFAATISSPNMQYVGY
jgi:hypothetical protein